MLKEQIERSLLIGIGLFAITREKAQAFAEEMVKQGAAAREEVKDLTEGLVRRGEEERNALRKLIREETNSALKDMHLATTNDIADLTAQVEALKAQLQAQEAPAPAETVAS